MAFYVLLGTAALHPSMRQLTEQTPEWDDRLTFGRLALLTSAAIAPPVLRLVQNFRGEPVDTSVLSVASIVLFLLVVGRMSGLIRQQERSARRERALRESGSALVTATNRDGHPLGGDRRRPGAGGRRRRHPDVRRAPTRRADLEVVAAAGGRADVVGSRFSLDDPPGLEARAAAGERRLPGSPPTRARSRDTLALPLEDDGSVFVAPLFIRDELRGLMVVSTPEEMPRTTRGLAPCPVLAGRPRSRERRPDRGPAAAAERGAVRLARAELVGHRHRGRARHDDQLREPVGASRARLRPGAARGHEVRRPDPPRRQDDGVLSFLSSARRGRGTYGHRRVPGAPP